MYHLTYQIIYSVVGLYPCHTKWPLCISALSSHICIHTVLYILKHAILRCTERCSFSFNSTNYFRLQGCPSLCNTAQTTMHTLIDNQLPGLTLHTLQDSNPVNYLHPHHTVYFFIFTYHLSYLLSYFCLKLSSVSHSLTHSFFPYVS